MVKGLIVLNPEETEAACQLLANSETVRQVDAIRIGEHYFFLQVGIGLEAATMQSTSSAQKKAKLNSTTFYSSTSCK
jgi:diacylglycerol kinase family enzyme